jgi:hypothetical protein
MNAFLLGVLWVATEGVAGCGYRRRNFEGLAQVSRCAWTVGTATAQVV